MKLTPLLRGVCVPLIAVAAASAQGCELRPSRLFAPPAHVVAGPPVRTVAARTAAAGVEGEVEAEVEVEAAPPEPPPLEWRDAEDESVVARTLQNGIPLRAIVRPQLATATVLVVIGTKTIPSPSTVAEAYANAALRGRWGPPQLEGARAFTLARSDFVAIGLTALSPVLEPVLEELLSGLFEAPLFGVHVDGARVNLLTSSVGFEPGRRAYAASVEGIFPPPHPYGLAAAARLPGSFRKVKTPEVQAFRDAHVTADNMMVAAAGNLDLDSLVATMSRILATAPRTPVKSAPTRPAQPSCAGRALIVSDPASRQTSVSVAYPAVAAKHPDVASLHVLAAALGGSLSTRLNVVLRRERAVSGAFGAHVEAMREGGVFVLDGAADPAHTAEALAALGGEIEALAGTPLADDDLLAAKIRAAHTTTRLDGAATAVRLAHAAILGTSSSDVSAIKVVTAEQVRAAAERYLAPARRCIVVVGDPTLLEPQLRAARLGAVSRAP